MIYDYTLHRIEGSGKPLEYESILAYNINGLMIADKKSDTQRLITMMLNGPLRKIKQNLYPWIGERFFFERGFSDARNFCFVCQVSWLTISYFCYHILFF